VMPGYVLLESAYPPSLIDSRFIKRLQPIGREASSTRYVVKIRSEESVAVVVVLAALGCIHITSLQSTMSCVRPGDPVNFGSSTVEWATRA